MKIPIAEVIRSQRGKTFFSFLIGFGLVVLLFHRPFGKIATLALSPNDLEGKVVKTDGKCYEYRVEDASCEISA
jgi:hypothetical protein